jgi:YVTN family beta-propeller protein
VSTETDPRIGSELLGYRLEELIGRGGMGAVYRAYDRRLKRNVALKLIAPELSDDASFRERFLTETELAASLEHPNVVPVYDAGDVDGQLYLAMRYVEGGELKAQLQDDGPLEPARALAICGQIAAALDAAHAHGLVHRDVKPSNVLLDADEHVYLADFGLSRRLADPGLPAGPGPSLGTPAYVAPEQVSGEGVDGRADVYSLGCVLYECLTGVLPYERDSELAMLFAHLEDEPPVPPEYPALAPVFGTALSKDPDRRYATCAELVEAAGDALGLRDGVVVRDRKAILLTAVGAALAAAAIVAGVLASQSGGGPSKPSTKPTLAPKVDSLQRIDPKTNALTNTIRVGSNPSAVAVGGEYVWVGSEEDQQVHRIDPRTDEVKSGVPATGPTSIAAGLGYVFVANADGSLTTIDPSTLRFTTAADSGSNWVAVGEDAVWACGPEGLAHINREGVVVTTLSQVGASASAVVTGGGAVWVLDDKLRRLWRVDPQRNHVVGRIQLGFDPGGVAFGRGRVWVTNNGGDAVVEIDPATGKTLRSIPVGDGPIGIAVGEGSVWTANYLAGTVSRIDPRRGSVIRRIKVGRYPTRIAVGLGGAWVPVRAG